MTKVNSIIDDEVSKFEWRAAEVSRSREREKELEKSNEFLFAAGLRSTDKGSKWERVRPFSAKDSKAPVTRGSRFRIFYEYGRN